MLFSIGDTSLRIFLFLFFAFLALLICSEVCKSFLFICRQNYIWENHKQRVVTVCPELIQLFDQWDTWFVFVSFLLGNVIKTCRKIHNKKTVEILILSTYRCLSLSHPIQGIELWRTHRDMIGRILFKKNKRMPKKIENEKSVECEGFKKLVHNI